MIQEQVCICDKVLRLTSPVRNWECLRVKIIQIEPVK